MELAKFISEHPNFIGWILSGALVAIIGIVIFMWKAMDKRVKENEQRIFEVEHNYIKRFDQVNKGISEILISVAKVGEQVSAQAKLCTLIQDQKKR